MKLPSLSIFFHLSKENDLFAKLTSFFSLFSEGKESHQDKVIPRMA